MLICGHSWSFDRVRAFNPMSSYIARAARFNRQSGDFSGSVKHCFLFVLLLCAILTLYLASSNKPLAKL